MEVQNATVPALERALNILEYLAATGHPVSLKTLSKDLNIPIASAFRLVKNLTNRGYVQESANGQAAYELGEQLTALATLRDRGNSLFSKAAPYMRSISAALGQTAQLAVMRQGTLTYIGQVLSDAPDTVSVVAPLYTPLNIHTSAAGKVLFSFLSVQEQDLYLKTIPFTPATPKTITDPAVFKRETAQVRAQGYGLDNEEYAIGIGCMAVPIFQNNVCISALGITGAIAAYRDKKTFTHMLQMLQTCARELSDSLLFC